MSFSDAGRQVFLPLDRVRLAGSTSPVHVSIGRSHWKVQSGDYVLLLDRGWVVNQMYLPEQSAVSSLIKTENRP